MEFSSAKGVLVVDPIEARNICTKKASSSIYCLFQIDNKVYRSKTTAFKIPSVPKWKEDSQCRFDIDPGLIPLLKVYVLEKTNYGLPLVVGKGELNLIDIFYQKKSDEWVKLAPMGQIDLELTFYQAAPMLPIKTSSPPQIPSKDPLLRSENKVEEAVKQKISSVDQVFVDNNKEERHRLRQLAKRVKRRYKESRSSKEVAMKEQLKKVTNDELLYVEVNRGPDKQLPEIPIQQPSSDERVQIEESIPDISVISLNDSSISQLDFNQLPFSADTIGTHMIAKLDELKLQQEREKEKESKKMYTRLSTEAFSVISRLERGSARPDDFKVEGGASEYRGDGTWAMGRLSDAVYTGERPKLPPKIPCGMSAEEYYMLQRKDYIDYFKTIL